MLCDRTADSSLGRRASLCMSIPYGSIPQNVFYRRGSEEVVYVNITYRCQGWRTDGYSGYINPLSPEHICLTAKKASFSPLIYPLNRTQNTNKKNKPPHSCELYRIKRDTLSPYTQGGSGGIDWPKPGDGASMENKSP